VHCSSKKCGFAVNLNSHEAAKPPEAGAARYHEHAPAAEGRSRLRRVLSHGLSDWSSSALSPPTRADEAKFTNNGPVACRGSCSPMEAEEETVRVGGSSGGVPPLQGAHRATEPGQPSQARRRSTAAACGLATSARLAGQSGTVKGKSAHRASGYTAA
jgi:hypothetical protein